jgi:HlyD family secretion protein
MMRMTTLLCALVLALPLGACGEAEDRGWLGYAEGENALIAPPQPGWVTSIDVARGETIAVGDVLFTLDATRELAARDTALAAIAAARAEIEGAEAAGAGAAATQAEAQAETMRSQREFERQEGLVNIGGSSRRELEQAEAALQGARARISGAQAEGAQAGAQRSAAEARVAQAEAALATAEFNLAERTVTARVAGVVEDIYFRPGEYAGGGAPVLSILPPQNIYVRFFIPEEDVAGLAPGDAVILSCDGCPDNLTATISFIAQEVEFTPPVIYSVGNREKLVFKAEARAEGGLALRPGPPVDVRLAE